MGFIDYQTQGAGGSQGFNKDFERTIKKLFDIGKYKIYLKTAIGSRKLTEEALQACEFTGINPEHLYEKYLTQSSNNNRSLEYFKESADNEEIA